MSQPHDRAFNFSAGPCCLPVSVLEEAQRELLNYKGKGMSVMEMSHRSKPYEEIINGAEANLRKLMGISDDYTVLFLQGGASMQFSMLPMSFLPAGSSADYVITGTWGKKALEAAQMVGSAQAIFDAKASNYNHAPSFGELKLTPGAAFAHYTSNETIQGVDFWAEPEGGTDWVCDMSSNILSRPTDVNKFAMIYAGAQKNMGPAGVVVVIIRKDFLDRAPEKTHPMLDYRVQAENGSMYNTPPCWSIYMCGLVYEYLLANGGLAASAERNTRKAATIYGAIDGSDGFYKGHAVEANRSQMNITFTLPSEDLTNAFLAGAKDRRLLELKGHRSVGGCRASVYNAFPQDGCDALAAYMAEFRSAN
ncbi:MAG: 3-phosphoserine/phosphohydroxythreonine transaminase [Chthonomonas sp.]|nr:3-phosphoserine/phosphohydroxythreonine transaminase [Chthonomonas sp.]